MRTLGRVAGVSVLLGLSSCAPATDPPAADGGWENHADVAPAGGEATDGQPAADPGPEAEPPPAAPAPPPSQRLAYDEHRAKSVLELQPWRRVTATEFVDAAARPGVASLVDLNPLVGAWYLVRLERSGGGDPTVFHLENPFPRIQRVALDTDTGTGLVLERDGARVACELWGGAPDDGPLAAARQRGSPFEPLCDGWLYLRNAVAGRRTSKEWAADFLRDRVWGGERITTLVRDKVFRESYRKTGREVAGGGQSGPRTSGTPEPPALSDEAQGRRLEPSGLGLTVERAADGTLAAGRFHPVRGVPGVTVSVVRPDMVAPEIVERQRGRVHPLDPKEASALVYMVAFDLSRLELGFALGTDHPRVGWSERVPDQVRDPALPGPDGIGTVAPLVRTGMLGPAEAARVVATFTGGFKRSHGAFKSADLGMKNRGSHYGFVEQGAVLSKLHPGLSTLAVTRDGHVTLDTWTAERNDGLAAVRFARQNGVPILERDPADGRARPGSLVMRWGDGNWSGSVDKQLRTLRAGACIQATQEERFLLYGYFTGATPSAMARVFEAYGCTDAMLLDMNALEHTYLAVYPTAEEGRRIERLIDEMEVLDKVVDGETAPRFVGFPDNRDFFYLLAKPTS